MDVRDESAASALDASSNAGNWRERLKPVGDFKYMGSKNTISIMMPEEKLNESNRVIADAAPDEDTPMSLNVVSAKASKKVAKRSNKAKQAKQANKPVEEQPDTVKPSPTDDTTASADSASPDTDAFVAQTVEKVADAVTRFCRKKMTLLRQMKFRKTLDSEMRRVILEELVREKRTDKALGARIFDECARLYDDNQLGEMPSRSVSGRNTRLHDCDAEDISARVRRVGEVDATLPEQRTPGWYEARRQLLSASDIWKAIGTPAQKNSLIYSKCAPSNPDKYSRVNMNSSLHWGQKYEPVSQQYYEYTRGCRVREYGCIPHKDHGFLGASPDGIVVESDRHPELVGRMLEIKNVISREITGVPKMEYWVQMQMQMECCDLEECDFLECKFEEYDNYHDFRDDTDGSGNMHRTHDGHWKGMFLCLNSPEGTPCYEYPDFGLDTLDAMNAWCDEKVAEMVEKGYTWLKYVYWRMPRVSCVLVPRNREWFAHSLPQFRELWETIVKERESGYEHRAPKKRKAAAPGVGATGAGGGKRRMKQTTLNVVKIDMHALDTFHGDAGDGASSPK
jgi:putative phage-type endonuclease